MTLRHASNLDMNEWLHLRRALWPDVSVRQHVLEMDAMLREKRRAAVFVAGGQPGSVDGFIEVTLSSRFNGTRFVMVACVEGWYVRMEGRGQGIGRLLMRAAEDWAREQACVELLSDTELDNELSQQIHSRLGFEESERVVLFRRIL